ncbi:hypothetical protein ACSAZK_02530 [Methanosarcina sp. Mfa9]|uniref:hypothetical protein n=1 Tax=Methanosarcina sp. Mfa9 TaxID=3439063 RepID=UPI003F853B7D
MTGAAGAAAGSWKLIDFGITSAIGGALSGTQGKRKLAADTTQRVSDSISQATSVMRRLNSTVVVQASQAEKEVIQTRTVTNNNHCHALTVLYYQVLQHYLVTVRLVDKRDVIFVKYSYINDIHDSQFSRSLFNRFTEDTAFYYRRILRESLLDPALECGFAAIEKFLCERANFTRRPPAIPPSDWEIDTIVARFTTGESGLGEKIPVAVWLVTEGRSQEVLLHHEGDYYWVRTAENLATLSLYRVDSAELRGYASDEVRVGGGTMPDTGTIPEAKPAFSQNQEDIFTLRPADRIRWGRIAEIKVRVLSSDFDTWDLTHLQIYTSHGEQTWMIIDEDVNTTFTRDDREFYFPATELGPSSPADLLTGDEYCCKEGLLQHLNYNKLYYSRAIWLAQDPEERALAFERYRLELELPNLNGDMIEGRLIDLIENRIVGVSGDYVAFPLMVTSLADEFASDQEIERRSIHTEKIISLPTRGIFAEAKLSHCNACEERDITRYWDWTESPCPKPPEIAPVEAGEHEVVKPPEGTPTTMPSPVVNIVNPPSIPDPTGLVAALEVLRTPNIFRDMSAVSELSDLLQELAEGAVSLVQARQRAQKILERSEQASGRERRTTSTTTPRRESPQSMNDWMRVVDNVVEDAVADGSMSREEGNAQIRESRRRMVEEIGSAPRSETPSESECRIASYLLTQDLDRNVFPGDYSFSATDPAVGELIRWENRVRYGDPTTSTQLIPLCSGTYHFRCKIFYHVDPSIRSRTLTYELPEAIPDISIPVEEFVPSFLILPDRRTPAVRVPEGTRGINIGILAELHDAIYTKTINIREDVQAGLSQEATIHNQIATEIGAAIQQLAQGRIGNVLGITNVMGLDIQGDFSLGGTVNATITYRCIRDISMNVEPIE